MNLADLTTFDAVLFALRGIVAIMFEHKLASALKMESMVGSFGSTLAYGRNDAARSIRGYVAGRFAAEVHPAVGEAALLNLAVALVKVGETFPVIPYYVGKGYRNGVAIAA